MPQLFDLYATLEHISAGTAYYRTLNYILPLTSYTYTDTLSNEESQLRSSMEELDCYLRLYFEFHYLTDELVFYGKWKHMIVSCVHIFYKSIYVQYNVQAPRIILLI